MCPAGPPYPSRAGATINKTKFVFSIGDEVRTDVDLQRLRKEGVHPCIAVRGARVGVR